MIKAMILAAGKGERMRPLTQSIPKPLLCVGKEPMLVHHLRRLAACGITEIVINVWYLGQQIVDYIGDGSKYGVKVAYSVEQTLLDTGGGVVQALPLLGKDPFLLLSADIYTDFPFNSLPYNPTGLALLVMVENPAYHASGDFGLINGKIVMQADHKYTYANIGVYRPEFFANSPQGAHPLRSLLYKHIADNLINGQFFSGNWFNIGTPADLELVKV